MRPPAAPALFQPGRATRGARWHGRGRLVRLDKAKNYHFDGLSTRADEAPCGDRTVWHARLPSRGLDPGRDPGASKASRGTRGARALAVRATRARAMCKTPRRAVGRKGSHCARTRTPAPWPRPSTAIARSCNTPRAHGLEGRDIHQGREGVDQSLQNVQIPGSNGARDADVSSEHARPATKRAALARWQMCWTRPSDRRTG